MRPVEALLVAEIVLGSPSWLAAAMLLAAGGVLLVLWGYTRVAGPRWVRALAALLKTAGILLLAALLVEPLFSSTRPKPGSNLFFVLVDHSRSLQLADRGAGRTRAAAVQAQLGPSSAWLTRLEQDFEVRRYLFDTTLRPSPKFTSLAFDGQASRLFTALQTLGQRYRGQPVAGILLISDGNATDEPLPPPVLRTLPPVYPVVVGAAEGQVDLAISRLLVTQTNFEAAPVTLVVELAQQGLAGRRVGLRVLDEEGQEVQRRMLTVPRGTEPLAERLLLKPQRPGVSFYTVHAFLEGEEEAQVGRTLEATLENNRRLAVVDRGGGPYRVLYVGGRPNWEFKFLRRALDEDDELQLVGLVRIARREPRFTFLGRGGERTNPLFRGFHAPGDDTAEQYDEPVLIRLGTEDREELRAGFPKEPEELFRYHALILDDVEAAFFRQDQLSLVQQFVSQRGGGLLMLGGKESFAEGGYARTPVGEMLPVYLERRQAAPPPDEPAYRWRLTREGWLQPWARLRTNESDETQRLSKAPPLKSLNPVELLKPGASVVAEVVDPQGQPQPALVVHTFGRGRVGALLAGDLWRWGLRRSSLDDQDLERTWRQMVRWLVADVPQRVEVAVRRIEEGALGGVALTIRARDEQFLPLDNAQVHVRVTQPDGRSVELTAAASDQASGTYVASFLARQAGPHRASVSVVAPDGSPVGRRETGWAVEPQTEEFRRLGVDLANLQRLANETGGEVVPLDGLDAFVRSLPRRKVPVVEHWTWPLWHQSSVFVGALACLIGEWALRRLRGMP
jgi:uncharacterized membrane protein